MTIRRLNFSAWGGAAAIILLLAANVQAAGFFRLRGNHPREISNLEAAVRAERSKLLQVTVVLGIRNPAALEQFLAQQHDGSSKNYRHWLTPAQFASRFGPTAAQIAAVAGWVRSAGLQVKSVNRLARTIDAAGTVEQLETAFQTTIVSSGDTFGNTSDPALPAEFNGLVIGINGLDNLRAVVPAGLRRNFNAGGVASQPPRILALADLFDTAGGEVMSSSPGVSNGGSTAFGPFDVETFYDESPLISAGNRGTATPDCIALDEDSDYLDAAVTLFATAFNFAPFNITRVFPDGTSPGVNGDETETLLDIDYAHATAPATPIHAYIDSTLFKSIQSSVTDNICGAISISFTYCSSTDTLFDELDSLFAQAAAQGQSVFISTGDAGAAGSQYSALYGGCVTGITVNASEMAASPHVTAVGGTTFSPNYNSSGNDISEVGVAPSGIETGWNASGGGASEIFSKPAWQSGLGVPNDSSRDIPDVAMIAWTPGVFIGADSDGTAIIQCCWGGTSLSAPLWAGYSRVIAAQANSARLGLINPTLYGLAGTGLAINGIEDVITGNNSYNGVIGYNAGPGYDLVTGWGSVDMTAFASAFNGVATASATPSATPTSTATRAPTFTPKPTFTPRPTATPTATGTPTPTTTPKPTPTGTPTVTATSKPTSSGTRTATATPKPTSTGSPTTTVTAKPTATTKLTATATAKPTSTAKPTATATPKPTVTGKPTVTTTAKQAATVKPTATATPKPTSTPAKSTPTHTAAATESPARTGTRTPTHTATHTPAPTHTGAPTRTATRTHTVTPTPTRIPTPTPAPGPLTVSATLLSFGNVKVGHSSGTSTVTLTNPSSSPGSAKISSVAILSGTLFKIASSTCTAAKVLARGASCAVGVSFTPQSEGSITNTLRFTDTARNSPQSVGLSGSGK